jgi:2-aminoadipate transaminase
MRGVNCSEEQVFLTSGAQQAVHLVVKLLLDPGQQLMVEDLCYPGFQQIVRFYKPDILTVASHPEAGIDIDQVRQHLANGARPAFIYTIPDGHNPLGVSLCSEKRTQLITIARQYRIPILEEDPYGLLSYSDSTSAPLRAECEELVFYVGSFSKILAPSLRVGWVVAPERLVTQLAILKESCDINMATFSQHVIVCMLEEGILPGHLCRLRSEYAKRRDAMLTALMKYFPAGAEWFRPVCGVYIWVRLPEGMDATQILPIAVDKYQVAFMPGPVFSTRGDRFATSNMRLNFSHPSIKEIEHGISRLGHLLTSGHHTAVSA